jgi:hypothetical protein
MSWNNVLPTWMIFEESAKRHAMWSCAMEEEWNAGISAEVPKYLWSISNACFESYNEGNWNHGN